MPNPSYQPNDPRFYEQQMSFPSLSAFIGHDISPLSPEEANVYNLNNENLAAYMQSRMPSTIEDPARVAHLANIIPGFDPNRPDREARRQLSAQARETIINVSIAMRNTKRSFPNKDRLYYTLLIPGTTPDILEKNQQIMDTLENGTPEAKGKLIEARVQDAMEWFNRCRNGLTDQEAIEHLTELHLSHDLVTNAQAILADANQGLFAISDETVEMLKHMELHSTEMDIPKQRVRAIANASYEYLDLDAVLFADKTRLLKAVDSTQAIPLLIDFLEVAYSARGELETATKIKLHEMIDREISVDTSAGATVPTIKIVGWNGQIITGEYDLAARNTTLDHDLGCSYALVTDPKGAALCFKIGTDGTVEKSNAANMRSDYLKDSADALRAVVSGVEEANKGFFIGSRAYSNARKSVNALSTAMQKLGEAPSQEALDQLRPLMEKAISSCAAYMDTKDPENFKNDREQRRYEAMEQAHLMCKRILATHDLQDQAMAAEKTAALGFLGTGKNVEFPIHPRPELRQKVHTTYDSSYIRGDLDMNTQAHLNIDAEKFVNNKIPESDVGAIADELRASINLSLEQVMLTKGSFDMEDARNVMSNMVALEMVKIGRTVVDGKIIAGPVERALSADPGQLIQSIRDDGYFQALTENVTPEMLEHFVMTDGAKTLANSMIYKAAHNERESHPGNPVKELNVPQP